MLKTPVLHPEILSALGSAGHLGRILISDGNYPHNTRPNPRAKIVWANFMPGVIDAVTALKIVARLVPIEEADVMQPARTGEYAMTNDPPIWADFRKVLAEESDFRGKLGEWQKPQFNERAASNDLCLVIATAETQIYANILITIGVVR
jgi:L-fucose mutarotase